MDWTRHEMRPLKQRGTVTQCRSWLRLGPGIDATSQKVFSTLLPCPGLGRECGLEEGDWDPQPQT